MCISPTSKSDFILTVGIGHSKLQIRIDEVFSIALVQCTRYCFFGKCTVCSLPLTWKVALPLLQSITARAVFKKGLPRMTCHAQDGTLSSIWHEGLVRDRSASRRVARMDIVTSTCTEKKRYIYRVGLHSPQATSESHQYIT